MADMKMNISVDEANAWVNKVEEEIREVNLVLNEVTTCVKEYQEQNDIVYKRLYKAANTYESAWKQLEGGYKKVCEELREAFKEQIRSVELIIEKIEEEAKKAKS